MAKESKGLRKRPLKAAGAVSLLVMAVVCGVLALTARGSRAQFRAIPDYVGIGAGLQFRTDINNHLSGVTPVAPRLVSFAFAQLPREQEGQLYFCSDCQQATPCQGGGSGAVAFGQGGVWTCGGVPPLTASFNANHNRMINLAPNSATGDALSQGQSHLNDLATAGANYSMGTNRLTAVGTDTTTGDALSRGQSTLNALAAPGADYAMNGHGLTGMRSAAASGEPCVLGQSHCGLGPASQASDPITYGQSGAQLLAHQGGAKVVSSSSTSTGSQVTTITINAPASIGNGNALVALLSLNGSNAQTITAPSGFAAITTQINNGSGLVQVAYCKIASSESGNYAFSWNNAAYFLGGIVQLSGVSSCTPDATPTAATSGGAQSISIPGVAATQSNDLVIDWATLGAGYTLTMGRGSLIFGPNGNSGASDYVNPVGVTPAVAVTSSNNIGMVGQQIAFVSSATLSSAPVLEAGAGNVLTDMSASVNGVIDAGAPPYNAACDGSTDDAAAIQAALNTGLSVELPDTTGASNSGTPLGLCRISVPLVDGTTNNRAFFGKSSSASGLFPTFGQGPAIIEANPTSEISGPNGVGPITAASHLGGGVALCWDGTGNPCGTPVSSTSGQFAYDMKDWLDDGAGQNTQACGSGTNPLNGCGPGNLTIEFEVWVPSNNSGGGTITASGSGLTGTSTTLSANISTGSAAANYGFTVNYATTGTNAIGCASNCVSKGAWHDVAYVYDNHSGNGCATASCARAYLDGVQTQAADVAGNIVQPTFDTWWLGANSNHFPNGDPGQGGNAQYFDGLIDFALIEKGDLYPSGTTFTPRSSKPTSDGNTILLLNFDKPANVAGFGNTIAQNGIVGADAGVGCNLGTANCRNEWSYIRVAPLLTGEIGTHSVHDMTIYNGGESVLGSNAIQLQLYNLNLTANHVPVKVYNNSYAMYLENAVINTNGEADIETAHNTGFNHAAQIKANNGTAFELAMFDQAGGNYYGLFTNPQLGGAVGDIYFGEDSGFTNFTCTGCVVDSENNAPTAAAAWLEGGQPTFIGGDMQSLASGSPPSIQLTGNTNLLTVNTHFEGGSPGGNPVVHFLTPPVASAAVTLVNPVVNNTAPNQQATALSDQPAHVNVIDNGLALSQAPTLNGGLNHIAVNKLADPAAATIAVVGTAGSSAAGPYYVVCRDANGGTTNVSPASNTLANAPSTLNASNYIQITWTAESGCNSWDVLKGNTTTALATGLNASLTSFNDTGKTTSAYTQPARNTTGDVAVGTMLLSTGITFPLPGTVVNGASFYCPNCDPPANPPVACTSSGAKTGAWVHGLNSQWICTP